MTSIGHAEPVAPAGAAPEFSRLPEGYEFPEFSWSPYTAVRETPGERRARTARKWARRSLLLGLTIASLVLVVLWVPGAFASAPGGCGGG